MNILKSMFLGFHMLFGKRIENQSTLSCQSDPPTLILYMISVESVGESVKQIYFSRVSLIVKHYDQ